MSANVHGSPLRDQPNSYDTFIQPGGVTETSTDSYGFASDTEQRVAAIWPQYYEGNDNSWGSECDPASQPNPSKGASSNPLGKHQYEYEESIPRVSSASAGGSSSLCKVGQTSLQVDWPSFYETGQAQADRPSFYETRQVQHLLSASHRPKWWQLWKCCGARESVHTIDSLSIAFDARKWWQYFGVKVVEPPLPSDIDQILQSPCPFWPGKRVEETHMLVLLPRIEGAPVTLNSLEEFMKHPKHGHAAQYQHYHDEIKGALGNVPLSQSSWILMTKDVLPDSRSKNYADQCKLIEGYNQKVKIPYRVPHTLEAVIGIFLEYVQRGTRLYNNKPWTWTRCQEKLQGLHVVVGGFAPGGLFIDEDHPNADSVGVGCVWNFSEAKEEDHKGAFDARKWWQYFGVKVVEPPLPSDIDQILQSPCPFWPGKRVEETHMLVLLPRIEGAPVTLNSLEEFMKHPKQGYATQYRYYWEETKKMLGDQPLPQSSWVLMTKDVLPDSRKKSYAAQCELLEGYNQKTKIFYQVPHVLEAVLCIFLKYVQSGTRLYNHRPKTYTLCQEKLQGFQLAVGGFSDYGLSIASISDVGDVVVGVACLRKL